MHLHRRPRHDLLHLCTHPWRTQRHTVKHPFHHLYLLKKAFLAGSRACLLVIHLHRSSPFNLLQRPSRQKVAMAAAAMETEPVANRAKVVQKAAVMDVARVAKAAGTGVVAVDAVDAGAMVEIARAAGNANASTPKEKRCPRMPIFKAQTLLRLSPPAKTNAPTAASVRNAVSVQSVETDQAVAAIETTVVIAASLARKTVQKVYLQRTATPRAAAMMAKTVNLVNLVNPAKVAAVVVAMAVVHARKVTHTTQTVKAVSLNLDVWMAKAPQARHWQTSKAPPMTAVPLLHRAMRVASRVKSAAAIAMAVNVAPGASAKSALICASRPNQSQCKPAREKPLRLCPLYQHQCPKWPMLRHPLRYQLRRQSPPALLYPVHACQK